MSAIDKYFNYFNDRLNESHKLDIIKMYNNIQTYDYYDLFDTDMSFNTINSKMLMDDNINEYTLLKPKLINHVNVTVISSNQTKIYKMSIFKNDKNKDFFVIDALREFYFQTTFREQFINNNITNIIVPEIHRYGIINIETNNEIICFAEMNYYDTSKCSYYNIVKQEQTSKEKVEQLYNFYKNYNDIRNIIAELEKQIQIYHDNLFESEPLHRVINETRTLIEQDSEDLCADFLTTPCIWPSYGYPCNLFPSNNKYILIDFGRSSTAEFDTTEYADRLSGGPATNSFMDHILYDII